MDTVKGNTENSETVLPQKEQDDGIPLETKISNIMQINTVVKTIFKFLGLKDFKKCRLVCSNWADLAEPLLRKRCKIVFNIGWGLTPIEFAKTFSDARSTLKFTSFKFDEGDWPKSAIDAFFEQQKQGRNLLDLEFYTIILKDENGMDVPNPCIDDWLVDLPVRKLSIVSSEENWSISSNLMISLDVLKFVEELNLDHCKIHSSPKYKMSPKIIKLKNVSFCNNKYVPPAPAIIFSNDVRSEILLNDVLDLKNAQTVIIECPVNNRALWATHILISLEKCSKINNLGLKGAKVVNWGRCNVRHIKLDGISHMQQNGMKCKSLTFQESSIDLSALPQEIESIWFGHWRNPTTTISCSEPINLPNLKRVVFFGMTVSALPHFKNCPNLVDVVVGALEDTLNLDWIPKSVKRLETSSTKTIVGEKIKKLDIDHLVLGSGSLDDIEKALERFNPKKLVLEWSIDADNNSDDRILLFLNKYKHLKSICIGPFNMLPANKFRESRISEFVNEKAHFYVFENLQGRGLSFREFEEFKVAKS